MASISLSDLYLFAMFSMLFSASSQRISDKMYEPITGAVACFRRLNGTHQVGCSSLRSGNVGILHFVENDTELDWLVKEATADPYIAVLHRSMFNWEVMLALKESNKVNGVVLISNGTADRPTYFSHEDTCPNRYSGLSLKNQQTCNNSEPWNPKGTRIFYNDWGFPVFLVEDEDNISKLNLCYEAHNSHHRDEQLDRSLCALEMNSYMLAAVDSKTCIRRSSATTILNHVRYCDPLGDRNVWSTLYPRYKEEKKNKTIFVLSARLDGTSMFDGLVPGALSPASGIVTLLMTARILAYLTQNSSGEEDEDYNVLFLLLHGESYDYIGSSRLVWDMQNGLFPMKADPSAKGQPPPLYLHNIALFVELGQISALGRNSTDSTTTLHLHQAHPTPNNVLTRNQIDNFEKYMDDYGGEVGLKFNRISKPKSLPPSSLQSFLAATDDEFPGVIVADHGSQFLNKYYHSIMDDSFQLNYTYQNGSEPSKDSIQVLVADLAQTLAKTLYRLINNSNADVAVESEPQLVDELFHCYLDTMNCSVFQAAAKKQKLDSKPAPFYVGVNAWPSPITILTAQTLALLVNETATNRTEETCHNDPSDKVYQYIWMNNNLEDSNSSGVCIKTTMNYSIAVSPAFFEIPDYDWSSGKYSTWTESVWREFSVRMFLKPSRSHENLTFSLGVVVLSLSFLIVYFANSRSHILFGNTLEETIPAVGRTYPFVPMTRYGAGDFTVQNSSSSSSLS